MSMRIGGPSGPFPNTPRANNPATTTHQSLTDGERAELNIGGGLLRISAGLEDTTDLIADVEGALSVIE